QELYRHCLQQVEGVRERLTAAGFSQQDIEHITYAQCALLDETVLSRDVMDDGQMVWLKNPLQSHFFNTLQAGELLYERMK
ncbi:DotU family type IV/VI secretion system protein, partial [Klebsiella pneumoniae]